MIYTARYATYFIFDSFLLRF